MNDDQKLKLRRVFRWGLVVIVLVAGLAVGCDWFKRGASYRVWCVLMPSKYVYQNISRQHEESGFSMEIEQVLNLLVGEQYLLVRKSAFESETGGDQRITKILNGYAQKLGDTWGEGELFMSAQQYPVNDCYVVIVKCYLPYDRREEFDRVTKELGGSLSWGDVAAQAK